MHKYQTKIRDQPQPSLPSTQSQLDRMRQQKHNRLIKKIQSYRLTDKDRQNITESKKQTEFEISIRYARCKQNSTYRFVHEELDRISDEELEQEFRKEEVIKFDLKSQRIVEGGRNREFNKFKTEESTMFQGRSISLKKIEPKVEVMLARRDEQGKGEQVIDTRVKTSMRKGSESKHLYNFPSLEKITDLKHPRSFRMNLPYSQLGIESKHKRLATEEIRREMSKNRYKLKTEQSSTKSISSKHTPISANNPLSKAELLLLEIKPSEYKKTIFNKIVY